MNGQQTLSSGSEGDLAIYSLMTTLDSGDSYKDGTVSYTSTIKNTGNRALSIANIGDYLIGPSQEFVGVKSTPSLSITLPVILAPNETIKVTVLSEWTGTQPQYVHFQEWFERSDGSTDVGNSVLGTLSYHL